MARLMEVNLGDCVPEVRQKGEVFEDELCPPAVRLEVRPGRRVRNEATQLLTRHARECAPPLEVRTNRVV